MEKTHGVVGVPLADLRGEPRGDSELVNQVLLGTPLTVLEVGTRLAAGWQRVRLPDYEGWLQSEAIRPQRSETEGMRQVCVAATETTVRLLGADGTPNGQEWTVFAGTRLPLTPDAAAMGMEGWVLVTLPDGHDALLDPAALAPADPNYHGSADSVLDTARQFLGVRYLWGGMTLQGIDCSGLVQTCYRVHGYAIPRDADEQMAGVRTHIAREALQPADLLFLGDGPDKVTHVMLYLGDGQVIHAQGATGVVIQHLDPGYPDSLARPDRYLGARRVITDKAESHRD